MGTNVETDGGFVKELADKLKGPQVLVVNEEQRVALPTGTGGWTLADLPLPEVEPDALVVSGLRGLVTYIKGNRDALELATLVVHVKSHARVELLGALTGRFRQRPLFAAADLAHIDARGFSFGQWIDHESFVIGLQAHFTPTDSLGLVLKLVGNIKDEAVRQVGDDGVTQTVTARAGVALVSEVEVPNPVSLAPYRTFREVEQPASRFVLRLRRQEGAKPSCALFEADGGAWKLEAVKRVAAWLEAELAGTAVAVVA